MFGNLIVHIILAILSTYLICEYYAIFFQNDKRKFVREMIFIIYCIWQIASLTILGGIPSWLRLIVSILFVAVVGVCYEGDLSGKIVFAVIYNAVWLLSELLTGSFFLLVRLPVAEYELLGSAISKLVLLFLIVMLKKFYSNDNMNVLSWKDNARLMVLPIGSMFFTYHLFSLSAKTGTQSDVAISLVAFVMILMINIVMFSVYIKLSESLELKRENSIFQLEIDLYNEHMKEKENAMLEFRKSKHDLKNKLIYLLDLMREHQYSEMEHYIEDLVDLKTLDNFTIAHSDNSLIDALINYKYETMKQYGIRFTSQLEIPMSFPLSNADLCVVLGNALDNAIEANMGNNVKEPYINLKMKYDQNNLVVIMQNSFDGIIEKDEHGNVITKKKDHTNHGFGVGSIQRVLKKYNGFMKTEVDRNNYKLTMIMYDACE